MKYISNFHNREERYLRKGDWHKHFAWLPVNVGLTDEQKHIKIWLEFVERRSISSMVDFHNRKLDYEYREIIWCWKDKSLSNKL